MASPVSTSNPAALSQRAQENRSTSNISAILPARRVCLKATNLLPCCAEKCWTPEELLKLTEIYNEKPGYQRSWPERAQLLGIERTADACATMWRLKIRDRPG